MDQVADKLRRFSECPAVQQPSLLTGLYTDQPHPRCQPAIRLDDERVDSHDGSTQRNLRGALHTPLRPPPASALPAPQTSGEGIAVCHSPDLCHSSPPPTGEVPRG